MHFSIIIIIIIVNYYLCFQGLVCKMLHNLILKVARKIGNYIMLIVPSENFVFAPLPDLHICF